MLVYWIRWSVSCLRPSRGLECLLAVSVYALNRDWEYLWVSFLHECSYEELSAQCKAVANYLLMYQRGSATAGPLAAFGLSSAIFSTVSTEFFGGDAETLLLLLTFGTTGSCVIGLLFIRVLPECELSITKDIGSRSPSPFAGSIGSSQRSIGEVDERSPSNQEQNVDGETRYGSLSSSNRKISTETLPDIRGGQLFGNAIFWMYFLIMTLLAGSGLHLINNVGLCVRAWMTLC